MTADARRGCHRWTSPFDVHPIQVLLMPHRAFGQDGAAWKNAFGIRQSMQRGGIKAGLPRTDARPAGLASFTRPIRKDEASLQEGHRTYPDHGSGGRTRRTYLNQRGQSCG